MKTIHYKLFLYFQAQKEWRVVTEHLTSLLENNTADCGKSTPIVELDTGKTSLWACLFVCFWVMSSSSSLLGAKCYDSTSYILHEEIVQSIKEAALATMAPILLLGIVSQQYSWHI